ncbi:MAG: hypothetical protein OXF85_00175 [Candidatus Saccharibacteria bacterium]|nr:hypothetical protein [Candidatus Saccharibacteria bacterium]
MKQRSTIIIISIVGGLALIILAIIFILNYGSNGENETNKLAQDEEGIDILSEALPANWWDLSNQEKKELNPYNCYEGDIINMINGECTISGIDIQYIHIFSGGPHAASKDLTKDNLHYIAAMKDNITTKDIDDFYNHFIKIIDYQNRINAGGFMAMALVENTLPGGVFALGAVKHKQLKIMSYKDLTVHDQWWRLKSKRDSSGMKEYNMKARYTLGPFDDYVFANSLYDIFDEDKPQNIFQSESSSQAIQIKTSNNDQLDSNCELIGDISLIIYDHLQSNQDKDVKVYGPDLNHKILEDLLAPEDQLNNSFRNIILNLLFQKTGNEYPKKQKYNFKFRFYLYNDKNDVDFSLYRESDVLEIIDFNECQ